MNLALEVNAARGTESWREPAGPARRRPLATTAVIVTAVALGALAVGLLLGGGQPEEVPAGLPDPGAATGWALRVADLSVGIVTVLAVGGLLTGALLVPDEARLGSVTRRSVLAAGRWAWAWAVATVLLFVLTTADMVGVSAVRVTPGLLRLAAGTRTGASLLVVAVIVSGVAVVAGHVATRNGARLLLLCELTALVPPALAGHASNATDHQMASSGLIVHLSPHRSG
jgi:putative copper resistance protein D